MRSRRDPLARPLAVLVATAVMLAIASTASAAIYRVTDLGTLGGETSRATAINDVGRGHGLGRDEQKNVPNGGPVSRAFRYRDGALTDLGPTEQPGEGSIGSQGYAINSNGDVAGVIGYGSGERAGIFRAGGSVSEVGCSHCYEPLAYGINDADKVVGGGAYF